MWFEWFDYIHIVSALGQGSPGLHSIVDLEALNPSSAIHPSKETLEPAGRKKKTHTYTHTKELLSMKRKNKEIKPS